MYDDGRQVPCSQMYMKKSLNISKSSPFPSLLRGRKSCEGLRQKNFTHICFTQSFFKLHDHNCFDFVSIVMESFISDKTRCTVMEKILRQADLTDGVIQFDNISKLLKNLYPDVPVDKKQLEEIKKQHDINDERCLDFEGLMKVLLSFLLQQSAEVDSFSDLNDSLTIDDLIPFSNL